MRLVMRPIADGKRATLGVFDDGATGEDTRQDSKAAFVEGCRKRISLDAFYGNDLTEHSEIDRLGMEARESARQGAGKLAAGQASECQDGKRVTLGVSDDYGATGEDTRQESKAAVVEDSRKRRSLDAVYANDFSEHSKIERSGMEARDRARLSVGEHAAGHASN